MNTDDVVVDVEFDLSSIRCVVMSSRVRDPVV